MKKKIINVYYTHPNNSLARAEFPGDESIKVTTEAGFAKVRDGDLPVLIIPSHRFLLAEFGEVEIPSPLVGLPT